MRKIIALILTSITLFGCEKEFINDTDIDKASEQRNVSSRKLSFDGAPSRILFEKEGELYTINNYDSDNNPYTFQIYKWSEINQKWEDHSEIYFSSGKIYSAVAVENRLVVLSSNKVCIYDFTESDGYTLKGTIYSSDYYNDFVYLTKHDNTFFILDEKGKAYIGTSTGSTSILSVEYFGGIFHNVTEFNGKYYVATEAGIYEGISLENWSYKYTAQSGYLNNFIGCFNYNESLVCAWVNDSIQKVYFLEFDKDFNFKGAIDSADYNLNSDGERFASLYYYNDYMFMFPMSYKKNSWASSSNGINYFTPLASDKFGERPTLEAIGSIIGETPTNPIFLNKKLYIYDENIRYVPDPDYYYSDKAIRDVVEITLD